MENKIDLNIMNEIDNNLRNLDHINQKNPLIYNNDTDTSSIKNIILIHDEVSNYNKFITASNNETYPIIYNLKSSKDDLKALLKDKFQKIDRIALIFHDSGIDNLKEFIDNKLLYTYDDLKEDVTEYSDNLKFMIELVKEFNISNLDYLACNTLQYDNWNKYYSILNNESNVIIGASNDLTGNLKYGGDWVLESINQDVRDIYFTSILENYQYTLATSSITQNGGTIYIRQDGISSAIQYSTDNSNYSDISWPCTITNTTPVSGTILNVQFNNDITFSTTIGGLSGYFIIGSDYINIDGANKVVTINGITDYPGLIKNGTFYINGFTNITIKNIGVVTSNSATLVGSGGWIAQSYFGRGISSGTITVTNTYSTGAISINGGGIYGARTGYSATGGTILTTYSYSTGNINESGGGVYGDETGLFSSATISATYTYSTGSIGVFCGGIYGANTGYSSSATISATNCYSTGTIGQSGGGIYGNFTGYSATGGSISATNIYSTGTIDQYGGGIYGSNAGYSATGGTITAINCYTIGTIGQNGGGIYGYNKNTNITSNSNCISSDNSTWSDTNATSTIGKNTDNSTNTNWLDYSSSTNFPWLLSTFNDAIYNPNNQSIYYSIGGSSQSGLFTPDYIYKIVTILPSTTSITINESTGVLAFSSTLTVGNYTINVLVGLLNSDNVYYAYNYNSYILTVNSNITEQPLSQTVAIGEDIYLNVKAIYSNSISYSWYKNLSSIEDSNKSTLVLYNANSDYDGTYYCEVTSNNMPLNSSNAVISVLYPNIPNPTVMPNPPNAVNKNIKYYQYRKLYNKLYNNLYNQLYNQQYNQQYNQLYIQLNNAINYNIIKTEIQRCYDVYYNGLNNIDINNYTLNNGNYNMLYNKIYSTFYIPLYQELYNLLYIPLYNSIYQKLTNKTNIMVYNSTPTCSSITLDPKSEIYTMYIELKDQLFNQLYSQLFDQLYNQLYNNI